MGGAAAGPSPFPPSFTHRVQQTCHAVTSALQQRHPEVQLSASKPAARIKTEGEPGSDVVHGASTQTMGCAMHQASVLDSLVRTILSQNTTDITSARAFASLKAAFPGGWQDVRLASADKLADAIREGGLADIKAARIQVILNTLHQERGECSLEHLRELPDEEVKQQLCRFKGVGPKTAACVLMFCMQRAEFPVDTHVLHIAKKLGWVPPAASREAAYEHLNACLPPEIKHDLHVLLVQHGKACCTLRGTKAPPSAGTPASGLQRFALQAAEDSLAGSESAGLPGCPLRVFYGRARQGPSVKHETTQRSRIGPEESGAPGEEATAGQRKRVRESSPAMHTGLASTPRVTRSRAAQA